MEKCQFSFIFTIGAGIHIFSGVSPIGSLSNNGLVRPAYTTSADPGLRRLRFFCRTDSTVRDLGELIGPGGTAITSTDVFEINTDRIGGELEVLNLVGSNDVTSSEQGVYTCRVPLQSGEIREINIGIYPNVFNSEFTLTVNSRVVTWGFSWFTGFTLGLESGGKITSVKARLCALHRMRLRGAVFGALSAVHPKSSLAIAFKILGKHASIYSTLLHILQALVQFYIIARKWQ